MSSLKINIYKTIDNDFFLTLQLQVNKRFLLIIQFTWIKFCHIIKIFNSLKLKIVSIIFYSIFEVCIKVINSNRNSLLEAIFIVTFKFKTILCII